jgi:hypothetical protein
MKTLTRDDVINLAYKAGFYVEDSITDDETGEVKPPFISDGEGEDSTDIFISFANEAVKVATE